jgi:hypothetical protein
MGMAVSHEPWPQLEADWARKAYTKYKWRVTRFVILMLVGSVGINLYLGIHACWISGWFPTWKYWLFNIVLWYYMYTRTLKMAKWMYMLRIRWHHLQCVADQFKDSFQQNL